MTPITFLRPRVPGPEAGLEDAVLADWESLFRTGSDPWALLGAAQVGAGVPDLTFCSYKESLWRLPVDVPLAPAVLGYLRVAGRARSQAIAKRTNLPVRAVDHVVEALDAAGVLLTSGGVFELETSWRLVLPEVIAVEVKVDNWRGAIAQAVRNVVFATRSFVAVPVRLARRTAADPVVKKFGIGVVAIGPTDARIVSIYRRTRKGPPRVWGYYYHLARTLVRARTGGENVVRRSAG